MNKHKIILGRSMIFLVITMFACTIFIGGPEYPDQRIPFSPDSVDELQQAVQTAVAAATESGMLTITINEIQLTSYLVNRLETQDEQFLRDAQAYLRDGQLQIYGTARQGFFEATGSIILTPTINDLGQLELILTSVDFGPLPLPQGFLDAVTAVITEAYTGALGPIATGFRIEGVSVTNGFLSISGRVR
ncbi:MAG: hypothetical protein ABIJ39_06440 [Chloroflexota bacterium]